MHVSATELQMGSKNAKMGNSGKARQVLRLSPFVVKQV